MVNRALIRLKVVQVVYAYCQNGGQKPEKAAKDLSMSLSSSQELYHTMLYLLGLLSDYSRQIVSHKERFSPESLHASERRFSENAFLRQLASNQELKDFKESQDLEWIQESGIIKNLYAQALESDAFQDWIDEGKFDWDADRQFVRRLYKSIMVDNEELDQLLETQNIYWVADKELTDSFIQKTFKNFTPDAADAQALLAQFADPSDEEYAKDLLAAALMHQQEYRELVSSHARGWEAGRLALMDVIILQVALAEIFNIPEIPVKVSINEYVDLAKYFSTPGSGSFVNGVLDMIAKEMVSSGQLVKEY